MGALQQGFEEKADIIDLNDYLEKQKAEPAYFSPEDKEALAALDGYAAGLKMFKPVAVKETGDDDKTGQTACFSLYAYPHTPWLTIRRQQGGNRPQSYQVKEGHFKEPRTFHDIRHLAQYVRKRMADHKAAINARLSTSRKAPA